MHRVVTGVVALCVVAGLGFGAQLRTTAQREARQDRAAAQQRVDAALAAVHDDAGVRDALASADRVSRTSALVTDARAAVDAALASARATLEASEGQVGPDDAPRAALAARIEDAGTTPTSPTGARALAAALAEAEQAVQEAVAAEQGRVAAAQEAARQAERPAASSPRAPASRDRCATTYGGPAFYTSVPTEGGDGSNGRLPPSALAAVSWTRDSRGTPFYLRSDAAAALERLNVAFRAALGHDLALDLTYRDHDTQVAMRAALGSVAAVPGTSSHGTGLAIDVPELPCEYGWDSAARAWLVANGPAYGWVSPTWARRNGSNPEYWHYEFRG